MDVLSLFIGLGIGLLAGVALAFVLNSNVLGSKSEKQSTHSEAELKAMLAAQSKQHLDSTREIVSSIQQHSAVLAQQLEDYEQSLTAAVPQGGDKETFFGEHASVFLRNSAKKQKADIALAQPDAQPRDFANNGSGVFSGSAAIQKD